MASAFSIMGLTCELRNTTHLQGIHSNMVAVLKKVVVALACNSQLATCISSSRGLRRDRWLLVW
jgi:hypothetical protein